MKQDRAILGSRGWQHFLDGKEVTQEEYERRYPPPSNAPGPSSFVGWTRPLISNALGCHPSQVAEMNERNRAAGLSVRYNEEGDAVLPDRAERRKLLRLERFYDKDGGYSD